VVAPTSVPRSAGVGRAAAGATWGLLTAVEPVRAMVLCNRCVRVGRAWERVDLAADATFGVERVTLVVALGGEGAGATGGGGGGAGAGGGGDTGAGGDGGCAAAGFGGDAGAGDGAGGCGLRSGLGEGGGGVGSGAGCALAGVIMVSGKASDEARPSVTIVSRASAPSAIRCGGASGRGAITASGPS
jgi:hypothetical protein